MADSNSWRRLCDALDLVTDASTGEGPLAALNDVRSELKMDPAPSPEGSHSDSSTIAGLAAVRVELEQRVIEHRARFASLTQVLETVNVDYALEKIGELVGEKMPWGGHLAGRGEFNRVFMESLKRTIAELNVELTSRGYDEWARSDVSDAAYILDRVTQLLDGDENAPAVRDAYLLGTTLLRMLMSRIGEQLEEIDHSYADRQGGWSAEGPPTDT